MPGKLLFRRCWHLVRCACIRFHPKRWTRSCVGSRIFFRTPDLFHNRRSQRRDSADLLDMKGCQTLQSYMEPISFIIQFLAMIYPSLPVEHEFIIDVNDDWNGTFCGNCCLDSFLVIGGNPLVRGHTHDIHRRGIVAVRTELNPKMANSYKGRNQCYIKIWKMIILQLCKDSGFPKPGQVQLSGSPTRSYRTLHCIRCYFRCEMLRSRPIAAH